MYGRVVVLQSANMVYLIFNTVCGFAQTREQILVFRFLSGIGGSAPQAVCFRRSPWCVCACVKLTGG
jgi:MFS family permease